MELRNYRRVPILVFMGTFSTDDPDKYLKIVIWEFPSFCSSGISHGGSLVTRGVCVRPISTYLLFIILI